MNRVISCILFVFVLITSLYACGDNVESNNKNDSQSKAESLSQGLSQSDNISSIVSQSENTFDNISVDILKNAPETDASNLKYKEIEGGVEITDYIGYDAIVSIPATIDGKTVVAIGDFCFGNDNDIKGVIIPDSVVRIGVNAFVNSTLEIFVSGKGLLEIDDFAFSACVSLHKVELNEGLESLAMLCFSATNSLKELYIPTTVTNIVMPFIGDGSEPVTIIAEAGSAAETYASEKGIPFKAK